MTCCREKKLKKKKRIEEIVERGSGDVWEKGTPRKKEKSLEGGRYLAHREGKTITSTRQRGDGKGLGVTLEGCPWSGSIFSEKTQRFSMERR